MGNIEKVVTRALMTATVAVLAVVTAGTGVAAARGWFATPTPNPPPGEFNFLPGVAPDGAHGAWAVGGVFPYFGYGGAFIEHRTDGGWHVVPAAAFPHARDAWLTGVAAVSPDNAWAVGGVSFGRQGAPPDNALIEHWNGHSWSVYPTGTHHSWLRRIVRVPHTTHLWAVGETVPWSPRPVAAYWDGRRWTFMRLPIPAGLDIEADWRGSMSVAAAAENEVWMVGFTASHAGASGRSWFILTWHWNGHRWRVTQSASPYPSPRIQAISTVPGSAQLWAVGYDFARPVQTTLTARYSGGRWHFIPSRNCSGRSANVDSYLNGVVAVTPRDVWAVGACAAPVTPDGHALIEHFDGHRWQLTPAPLHAAQLDGITRVPRKGHAALWAVGWAGLDVYHVTRPTDMRPLAILRP